MGYVECSQLVSKSCKVFLYTHFPEQETKGLILASRVQVIWASAGQEIRQAVQTKSPAGNESAEWSRGVETKHTLRRLWQDSESRGKHPASATSLGQQV
jgi:hypothetical protein